MNDDQRIKADLWALSDEYEVRMAALKLRARELIQGYQVRIIRNWNGQPYGDSRPSRKGKTLNIEHVSIDPPLAVYVVDFPYDSPPSLDDVEFVKAPK